MPKLKTLTKIMLITKNGKMQRLLKKTKFILKILLPNNCSKGTISTRIYNQLHLIPNQLLEVILQETRLKPKELEMEMDQNINNK